MFSQTLIRGKSSSVVITHCDEGNMFAAFSLFRKIIKTGHRPTTSTLNDLFRGLCCRGKIYKAIMFYNYTILKGFQLNHHSYSILINGLCEIGETKVAIHLSIEAEALQIDKEQKHGLCVIEETKTVTQLSQELLQNVGKEQIYDAFTVRCLYQRIILRLCRDRHLKEAHDLFSEMIVKKIMPSNVVYCCLVYGYCITGQFKQAIALLREFGEALRNISNEQDVKAAKLVTEQEVKTAKRAVAVLIKRGVKPDFASYQSVSGGLYKGGRNS